MQVSASRRVLALGKEGVGRWVLRRAAGQLSTRLGATEDTPHSIPEAAAQGPG